jgi:UDP-N-acetylglucosamine:LPS N-acetylglucosamine transferase
VAKPTIILATDNGVGMGHLARATAIAQALEGRANPIIVSVAGAVAELPEATGIPCEYIPGKTRGWISRTKWDRYFRDRLLAIAEETGARVISFDGVTPYPGFILTKNSNSKLTTVWVRRGLWRKNRLRFVLPLQSAVIDNVIEPGDFASEYDNGPTSKRRDAIVTSPVSLYQKSSAISRSAAREALGLDQNRPAVLVQLGTGDSDMNAKLTAALKGLSGWQDLQIVLTKEPVDSNGVSLVPQGMAVKVVRFFPLARALKAFDGAITATGYNSAHELLPAQVPTVFIANIRGTDMQETRAQWCADKGFALRADQSDLSDIEKTVSKLQSHEVRSALAERCKELPATNGAFEIAETLLEFAANPPQRDHLLTRVLRSAIGVTLKSAIFIYRSLKPYQSQRSASDELAIFSDSTDAEFLRRAIKGNRRFEHLITGASEHYKKRRGEIASAAYGE